MNQRERVARAPLDAHREGVVFVGLAVALRAASEPGSDEGAAAGWLARAAGALLARWWGAGGRCRASGRAPRAPAGPRGTQESLEGKPSVRRGRAPPGTRLEPDSPQLLQRLRRHRGCVHHCACVVLARPRPDDVSPARWGLRLHGLSSHGARQRAGPRDGCWTVVRYRVVPSSRWTRPRCCAVRVGASTSRPAAELLLRRCPGCFPHYTAWPGVATQLRFAACWTQECRQSCETLLGALR